MAEKHLEAGQDGYESVVDADTQNELEVNSIKRTSKRFSSTSPISAPPHKSPRSDFPSPSTQTLDAEGHSEAVKQEEMQMENTERPSSPNVRPTGQGKSWRRATLTRRSLPALPNPYQDLCRGISTSLSSEERLEKLMETSMRLAIEKTRNSLQSVPNASMESFQKQVEHIQKEWRYVAKSIRSESQDHELPASAASSGDPSMQRAMEKAISRLQAESESWEALLNKHQSKAEELERKVEEGQERGVSLDTSSVTQSSQYHVIQSKPDYQGILRRQQPKLQTVALIMDAQCKMIRGLLNIKEQSQLLVKEASGRLAAEAGFQDLSPDPIRNLMAAPSSSAT